MARSGPPAYAWDWFGRQRLLWREVRSRLMTASAPAAARYAAVETRAEVLALLRADYPRDPAVRRVVHDVVAEMAFLGRTDVPFARLGATTAPRGMRWWWTAITGEELGPAPGRGAGSGPATTPGTAEQAQLRLDDVHEGYGG